MRGIKKETTEMHGSAARASGDASSTQTLINQDQMMQLKKLFARAAVGDFSQDAMAIDPGGDLAPLLEGLQGMLSAMREKVAETELLQDQLAALVEDRTKALERSQSYFRSVVEHAPNYIQIVDRDLRLTFTNRLPKKITQHDVIGVKIGSYSPPKVRQYMHRKLRQVIRTGKPTEYEYSADIGQGLQWFRSSVGPIWEDGKVSSLVMITFDTTEDKHRIDALHEGKRVAESDRVRYSTLLDSIGEGLIVINEHGNIANANPSAAKMLGYEVGEMIGEWFPRVVEALDDSGRPVDPLDRPAIRSISDGRIISESVHYRRKDGSTFPAAVTVSPVVIQGKPLGTIEVFRDLTQEHELDQAKEEFVSLASHQLRTPATGVKAYISMLLDGYAGTLTERQEEFLHKVFESNERQLQIVNDMLNVARADAGRIIPEMVSTNLSALVQDIIDEQRATIAERHQQLEIDMPASRVEVVMDPKLMRMVIENLVSNASKYTKENGMIRIRLLQTAQQVSLHVVDSGVGIAQDDLPRLFRRFSRINNPLSTQRGGSGLGLYLAQTIVLLHQGRLSVESQLNVGTTFTVELPRVQAALVEVGAIRRMHA